MKSHVSRIQAYSYVLTFLEIEIYLAKLTAEHFNYLQSSTLMNSCVKKFRQASPRLLTSGVRIKTPLDSARLAYWSEFERDKDFCRSVKVTHLKYLVTVTV